MTEVESRDMIERGLPALSEADVKKLAAYLYGYALVTKYVCVLLEHGTMTVSDYVSRFMRHRPRAVSDTPSDEGELLVDILKAVTEQVHRENADAARLLDCVGTVARLCGHGSLPHEYLSAYLLAEQGKAVSSKMLTLDYLEALRVLRRFGFIEREELGCIGLHPLTTDVLHVLTKEKFTDISTAMVHAYVQLLPAGRKSGIGGWWEYKTYSEAVTRSMGHVMLKEIAYLYIDLVLARASTALSLEGIDDRDFIENWLHKAVEEHAKNPKVAAKTGRLAYNTIEGHGSRLDFLLSESQLMGGPRVPTLEEVHKKFAEQ